MYHREDTLSKGAGIVIVKKIEDEIKVLCLFEEKKKSKVRKYDLTKGSIDKSETPFQTATREVYEESGIKKYRFSWGKDSFESGGIIMYLAETNEEPKITANPKTGIIEHDGYEWNSFDVSYVLMPDYLKPFISWADKKIKGDKNVKIQNTQVNRR